MSNWSVLIVQSLTYFWFAQSSLRNSLWARNFAARVTMTSPKLVVGVGSAGGSGGDDRSRWESSMIWAKKVPHRQGGRRHRKPMTVRYTVHGRESL